ncbi:MAG: SGNH/GDSL hydrolase family protein [Opitutales bacterium]|nr:SGNH/GDSL hydrolase family protein [Opitutales bacterium]
MIRFLSTSLIVLITAVFAPASQTAEEAWYSIALRNKENDKNKAFLYIENNPALPNVLIYGDSISIAYTPIVRGLLEGEANVYRLHVNGGFSASLMEKMDTLHETMREGKIKDRWTHEWDVIQVNVGLHDLKYVVNGSKLDKENGKQVASLSEYEQNLRGIFAYLKREHQGAKIVFALTTPVPEGERGRHAGDAKRYNEVALKVLREQPDIVVNDLYSFTVGHHEQWWTRPGNVHFNSEGIRAQGEAVAYKLKELLRDR